VEIIPKGALPIGYSALIKQYNLNVMPHFRLSYLIPKGSRRTLEQHPTHIYLYDNGYALDDPTNPLEHLTFSFKHDGLNLEITNALFANINKKIVTDFIAHLQQGKYHRIIWYLYERFTNKKLQIPDLTKGTYVTILDPKKYYTTKNIAYTRYRIHDNLLGNVAWCPIVRKSPALLAFAHKNLSATALSITKKYSASVLERASTYLYTKETISSYQIEREQPSKSRLTRFIKLIKKTESIPVLSKATLLNLQHSVVEQRFANNDYRTTQNYIGQLRNLTYQIVHYISPQPHDVAPLMQGLLEAFERMLSSHVDPIVIAATVAFGFVFIHPFDDGNGRLHRFLIHYILHRTKFTPQGMIFPVSAVILHNIEKYTQTLESFSKPLMERIVNYDLDAKGNLKVLGATKHLYQYLDYTKITEFLADCVTETVHNDFKEELQHIVNYDHAKTSIQKIVDLPDALINLCIALITQNNGSISKKKRTAHFSLLTDAEVKAIERIVQRIMM